METVALLIQCYMLQLMSIKRIVKKYFLSFACTLGGNERDSLVKKALIRAETRSKSLEDLTASPGPHVLHFSALICVSLSL